MNTSVTTKIKCEIDGVEAHYLPSHLLEYHSMTVPEYLSKYPNAELESKLLQEKFEEKTKNVRRSTPPEVTKLTVDIAGALFEVNYDVPEEACLPLPEHYRVPQFGSLGKDIKRACRYFRAGRSTWVWGPPGSGKDAFPSALCALTRTPSQIFSINPDIDIMSWFYDKTFNKEGTSWEFGELFKALVYGYVSPISGRRIPMTIVLSDFDRAGRSQAEAIRLVSDSIQGRVKGPKGETYNILPGTRLWITANTMGTGDPTGKCISANVLDSSILDRIERKVMFHSLDWRDEEPIIRAKFPLFTKHCENLLSSVGDATAVLRKAVEDQSLYGEFSHRGLCTWIGDCEDILAVTTPKVPKSLLKQGFMSYADGLPDVETKNIALTLVDPYFKGGALPHGDVSHVNVEAELDF